VFGRKQYQWKGTDRRTRHGCFSYGRMHSFRFRADRCKNKKVIPQMVLKTTKYIVEKAINAKKEEVYA
jgi:hypothetical protein